MTDIPPQTDAPESGTPPLPELPELPERLRIVRAFRRLLATRALPVARRVAAGCPARPPGDAGAAEVLASEVLPLLSAARFLEREARFWLRPQRLGARGRPLWLAGCHAEIFRVPHGRVGIVAAGNYPLFLPGVQVLQALTAGNHVSLKPAPAGVEAARWIAELLGEAGLPQGALHVTGPGIDDAAPLLHGPQAADFVLVTGGERAAAAVAQACAQRRVPCVIEASGCDAAHVLAGADLALAARSIAWGLRLHGSQTCIAPRRVLVEAAIGDALEAELDRALPPGLRVPVDAAALAAVRPRIEAALAAGARLVRGTLSAENGTIEPLVIAGADPSMELLRTDSFAPVTAIVAHLDGPDALVAADQACPYALGASVFGPEGDAARLAGRLRAGVVIVNDLIAPTADPRLPFGGAGASGHGVTRGAEGLLAMTRPRSVVRRRGSARPHLVPPEDADAQAFAHAAAGLHGDGLGRRFAALRAALPGLRAILERANPKADPNASAPKQAKGGTAPSPASRPKKS